MWRFVWFGEWRGFVLRCPILQCCEARPDALEAFSGPEWIKELLPPEAVSLNPKPHLTTIVSGLREAASCQSLLWPGAWLFIDSILASCATYLSGFSEILSDEALGHDGSWMAVSRVWLH